MNEQSYYRYLTFLFIPLLLIFVGCGDRLTGDRAKQIIIEAKKYPIKDVGTVVINQKPNEGMIISKNDMPVYIKMLSMKLIEMNIVGIDSQGVELYDVKLTDEGKKYVLNEKPEGDKIVVEILLGELIFDKLISIKKADNGTGYDVDYLQEVSKLTPFGTCLIDKPIYDVTSHLVWNNGKWDVN
jgi:hypothetical protein